ncbi:MAG: hypothetical protein KGL42_13650 [Betaproteobacteria bacterium]|nr:hypothetical protein [Betaproteobacteria bacterium]
MGFVFASSRAIFAQKAVLIALVSYLLYIAITCPCVPYLACHRRQFYIVLAACAMVVLVLNGFHFYNSTD